MKKKIEGRTVLLHPYAKTALSEWLKQLEAEDLLTGDSYVFRSRKGHNRPISRQQADAFEQSGIELEDVQSEMELRELLATRLSH
jgi:hypothetical protein